MSLPRSWFTTQPPANEKLTGTAKTAELYREFGPRLASGEAAAAGGLVIAGEGETAAAAGLLVLAGGVVVVPLPPQAASAIKEMQTSPMRRLVDRAGRR